MKVAGMKTIPWFFVCVDLPFVLFQTTLIVLLYYLRNKVMLCNHLQECVSPVVVRLPAFRKHSLMPDSRKPEGDVVLRLSGAWFEFRDKSD